MNFGFIEFNLVTNRSEKHLKSINGFEEYCPQKKKHKHGQKQNLLSWGNIANKQIIYNIISKCIINQNK